MATSTETTGPTPGSQFAKRLTQAVGAGVLAATAWPAAVLVAGLPRHYGAASYWLVVGISLPLWVPCWAGGVALLRGRPSGFLPLHAAAALLVASEVAYLFPSLHRVLGPARYGGVCRSWPVVLALLALPVLAHRLSILFLPPEPAQPGRRWCGRLCLLLALGTLYVGCSWGRQQVEQEAGGVVRRGITASGEGRPEDALREWGGVIDRYPYTSAWGVAVLHTGVHFRERHRYRDAIARFEALLAGRPDYPVPGGHLGSHVVLFRRNGGGR